MQLASQTLVALMCMLRLKKVRSPCSRSRTSLASAPTSSRFGCSEQRDAVLAATAARPRGPCRECAAKLTASPPAASPSASRSHGDQAGAADQRRRFLARQRRVVGVGAQAQRALGDDRRRAARRRRSRTPSARAAAPASSTSASRCGTRGQRQPAEREAAERVQAVGLADRRRHHAPQRRVGQRRQPDQPLAVVLAAGERHPQQHAQPGGRRGQRDVGAAGDAAGRPPRRARRSGRPAPRRPPRRRAVGGVARAAPGAVAQQLPRAREHAVPAEARVARGHACRRGRTDRARRVLRGGGGGVLDGMTRSFSFHFLVAPAGHQLVRQPELIEHAPDDGVEQRVQRRGLRIERRRGGQHDRARRASRPPCSRGAARTAASRAPPAPACGAPSSSRRRRVRPDRRRCRARCAPGRRWSRG